MNGVFTQSDKDGSCPNRTIIAVPLMVTNQTECVRLFSLGRKGLDLVVLCPVSSLTAGIRIHSLSRLQQRRFNGGSGFPFRRNIHYHLRSSLTMKAGPKSEAGGRRRRAVGFGRSGPLE